MKLNWSLRSHDGYEWFELYANRQLVATVYHEIDGWVWRTELISGLPFHEAAYYLEANLARQICEQYVGRHLR